LIADIGASIVPEGSPYYGQPNPRRTNGAPGLLAALTALHRRLSRDFVVYGFGEVAVKLFSLVTLPIYTRIFDPAEYGALSIVLTLNGLLMAVIILGGDSAYARFYFRATTVDQKRRITSTWIGFLAAWSTLVVFILLPFAPVIADWALNGDVRSALIVVPLLAVPVVIVNRLSAQVLRNEFRAAAFTTLNIASVTLSVTISLIAAVPLGLGILGILVGALCAEAIMLPIRLWSARSMLMPYFRFDDIRPLLAFGIPLVPISLAYWVFLVSDRILLAQLATLEQVGLYSVAASLVGLTSIVVSALGQAWSPHATRVFEEDPDYAPRLFGRMLTYVLAGFGFLCVGITAFAPELLRLLTAPSFSAAVVAVAPLALGMVAYASTQVTAGGITLKLRTRYMAIHASVAAAINVGLNLVLIPEYAALGSAWATMIAYTYLTLAYLVTSQRLWAVAYERRRSITVLVLLLAFVLAIVVKGGYCLGFIGALFLLRAFDNREVQAFAVLTSAIRRRVR
jgi:O-antigen/teichoic acid export membrane protein